MKIAVPSYQVRSGYMPVCWSGTSLFEILDPPLITLGITLKTFSLD